MGYQGKQQNRRHQARIPSEFLQSEAMNSQPPTGPRKRPKQARAKVTVDAVLEATARILATEGYDALNTNKVADTAGVSVGSLYQYFPNKAALIAALVDRHVGDELRVLGAAFEANADAPLPQAIRALITAHVDLHQKDVELTRALHAQIPRLGVAPQLLKATQMIETRLINFLRQRPESFEPDSLEIAAFLVVHGVETLNERYLLERRDLETRLVIDELVNMVYRYLAPS